MSGPARELEPGFIVIHGNQSETLRDLLRDWTRAYPLSPLENEVILVQSNGIAQWLQLSLAADPEPDGGGGFGIAAALDIQLPSRFIWQAYRAVLGDDQVPDRAPFGSDLLTWRLMRLLPQWVDEPDFAPLRRFLQDDPQLRRRHQLAAQLADRYDQYQVYRADWLADWAEGRDLYTQKGKGDRQALPAEHRWQARLWRALLADAGEAAVISNRAVIHQRFMAACAEPGRERPAGLPRRVLVFGLSALPRQSLDVLSVLGRWCQILMCVQNPCQHFWADLIPDRALLAATRFRHARRPGHEALQLRVPGLDHGHALLAAWGRQGRDFIDLLAEHDEHLQADSRLLQISRRADVFVNPVEGPVAAAPLSDEGGNTTQATPVDTAVDDRAGAVQDEAAGKDGPHGDRHGTMLQQLQQDILDLRPLVETRVRWPAVDPDQDRSIRFHVCHSPQREVEVLHDQLLAAFEADPGLQPRDVMVMVPEIDAYAPHVQAVFGLNRLSDHAPADGTKADQARVDQARFIPFTMADQAARRHEPLLAAVEFLLNLPQARVAVSDVLDLLDVPAVQRRFNIEADRLPLLRRWIEQSGIRWGLNAAQRESLEMPDPVEQNSWIFGLKRMLLGYAVGAQGDWAGIEPLDEISGLDAAQLGHLVALVAALTDSWQGLREAADPDTWAKRLSEMLARFFDAEGDEHEAMLLLRLNESLQQWREDCEQTGMNLPLPLSVVREHWLANLDDGGLSKRFFAGAVTFATLMPMRAIPFRQVYLLGMNDGDYPRSRQPADFDLMAQDYRPGDRSRREDDRYLFLEALLSARERLSISWVGRSIHDDTVRPPSVLVAQLRDHLAAGWRLAQAPQALLDRLTTEHRLQPFSRAYFDEAGRAQGLFTYAETWRPALEAEKKAAASCASARAEAQGAWPTLPPMPLPEALSFIELGRFLKDPAKQFFIKRLNIVLEKDDEVTLDQERFSIDGLDKWQFQHELVDAQRHALVNGQSREEALDAGLARLTRAGELPVGAFGALAREKLAEPMQKLFDDYAKCLEDYPIALPDQPFEWPADVAQHLPAVTGVIDQLREAPDGRRIRVVLTSRSLLERSSDKAGDEGTSPKGKKGKPAAYRHDQLVNDWVVHLAMQVSDQTIPTRILGKNGHADLNAMSKEAALAAWQALLMAWRDGMRHPLPFAIKTGFVWLFEAYLKSSEGAGQVAEAEDAKAGEQAQAGEQADSAAVPGEEVRASVALSWPVFEARHVEAAQKIRKAYEGDGDDRFGNRSERDDSPYLLRAYPDIQSLWAAGALTHWARVLLLPFRQTIGASGQGAANGASAGASALGPDTASETTGEASA